LIARLKKDEAIGGESFCSKSKKKSSEGRKKRLVGHVLGHDKISEERKRSGPKEWASEERWAGEGKKQK